MKPILFIAIAFGLSISVLSCDKCNALNNSGCICTLQYDPVCGCDNVTYGNSCQAECANVEYSDGECN